MSFRLVVLWSDALLWLLVLGLTVGGVWAAHQPYLRNAWRKVGESGVAMGALTVLAAFVTVGLLDSLHYQPRLPGGPEERVQYAPEVLSALDALATGLRERRETTYSAPFAIHLFAKEAVERGGVQVREFPRLQYGGRHLAEGASTLPDIALRAAVGMLLGLAVWAALVLVLAALVGRRYGGIAAVLRHWRSGGDGLAFRPALVTLLVLCLLAGPLLWLSGSYHVFGTDKVGQDVFYLTLKSIRTALVIGTLTPLVTLPLAILLGIVAGYKGGRWDDAIQYLYTVLNSIPGVLLIAAMVLMMQVVIDINPQWFETAAQRADARLLALCFILGLTSWTGLCRLLRAETLKLRELDYVQAARAFGVAELRIMGRHILPNLFHIVLIALVMDFSGLVLSEAVLSYIGIGVDPTMISFGTMINAARLELSREPVVWWSLAAAFVFMFSLVLAANLFADAVRDAFDPRWQGGLRRKAVAA